jgi:glutaredoxin
MASGLADGEPRIVILTRPGCHLCEEAVAVVDRICADTGDTYEERNVDLDEELLDRYDEQVPVIFVDGREHDFWRVDEARLRKALRKRPRR